MASPDSVKMSATTMPDITKIKVEDERCDIDFKFLEAEAAAQTQQVLATGTCSQQSKSLRRFPPGQCNYQSTLDLENNLHKTVDIFSHSVHHKYNRTASNASGQNCHSCHSTFCLDYDCWDPANHRQTIVKHPQLRNMELKHERMMFNEPIKKHCPPGQPSMRLIEGWDYFDLSDDSSEGEGDELDDDNSSEESDNDSRGTNSLNSRSKELNCKLEVTDDEKPHDQYEDEEGGSSGEDEDWLARLIRGGHVNPRD